MSNKISKELVIHRIEQAKNDLADAKLLYNNNSYLSANNRAYYSIFHAIRAVLALEPIDFKKHKDVLAYFNKNYVNTEIFPKTIGKRIIQAVLFNTNSSKIFYQFQLILCYINLDITFQTCYDSICSWVSSSVG